jgi:hypothetical protein
VHFLEQYYSSLQILISCSGLLPQPLSTVACSAQTWYTVLLHTLISPLPLFLVCLLSAIIILVVKRELLACLDVTKREERDLIQESIVLVPGHGVDYTVGITRVIDEARRAAVELAIDLVEMRIVWHEFVEGEEIAILALARRFLTSICFLTGDHFTPICVDELSLGKTFGGAQSCIMWSASILESGQGGDTPSSVLRPKNLQSHGPSLLHNTALAYRPTSTVVITLINWPSLT